MAEQEQDQRTEQATPRRRAQAREEGQVALSSELVVALLALAWLVALAVGGGALARSMGSGIEGGLATLGALGRDTWSVQSIAKLLVDVARNILTPLAALVLPLVLLGFFVSYGQIGFQLVPKAIELDFSKVSPAKGWGRIADKQALIRVGLALAKIVALTCVVGGVAWSKIGVATGLADQEVGPVLAGAGHIVFSCSVAAVIAILVLALADLGFQKLRHERNLRMTRNEVREEVRNMEGDPHVRARVRRIQREMARRRMLADVPKATVVITNPTHVAVAIRYERAPEHGSPGSVNRAPKVVAKGVELVALRIRETALGAGVPVHEDPPLARALHAQCEIGDEIPVGLYKAVAGVLAYVYRLRSKGSRSAAHRLPSPVSR